MMELTNIRASADQDAQLRGLCIFKHFGYMAASETTPPKLLLGIGEAWVELQKVPATCMAKALLGPCGESHGHHGIP